MMSEREPAVAGTFYPGNEKELEKMVEKFLDTESTKLDGELKGIIVPHAGYTYSGIVAGKAFSLLRELDQSRKWRVVLLGPSHTVGFNGASISKEEKWLTPLGEVRVEDCSKYLSEIIVDFPASHLQEHSLEVQLPFLQKTLENFVLLPLAIGQVEPKELALELEKMLGENTLIVVSSDLSHYYPDKTAKEIDAVCNEGIPSLDVDSLVDCEACGKIGILSLMHLAKKLGWKGHFIDYKTSGDISGNKSQVVGYGAYAFTK